MALASCRSCGKEVATTAPSCPHCGEVNPAKSGPHNTVWGAVGCLGFLVLLGVVCVAVLTPDDSPSPERSSRPDPIQLQATARVTGTQLHVTNHSSRDWRSCTIDINPGIIRSGYSQGPVSIAAGETVTGGLMAFTKGGERFNPMTHVVETVSVSCRQPEGYWTGTFR